MASIISALSKCAKSTIVLSCVGACLLSSCQTRYFTIPSLSSAIEYNKHDSIFNSLSYTRYALNMRQLTYFKNNVEEMALMTDYSKLHKKILFFNDMGKVRPNKFHTIEAWLANNNQSSDSTQLYIGQPVAIITAKGKKLAPDSSAYELIHIYYGQIISDTLQLNETVIKRTAFKAEKRVTVTGKNKKVNYKETTRNMNLTAYLKPSAIQSIGNITGYLEVQALLDRNHNQIGAEKAMIFNFEQIYGEPLWLVRRPR